jgi:multiple sugar transport system permease protein
VQGARLPRSECSTGSTSMIATAQRRKPPVSLPQRKRRRRLWSRESGLTFYVFASPWIIGFLLLTLTPMIYALAVSFTDYNGMGGHWHWIGTQNFSTMLNDSQTWSSLWLTLKFMVIWIPLNLGGSLGLAMLLNRRFRGLGIFRTIFYIPAVVPVVAGALAWKLMFDTSSGLINWVITNLGGPSTTWLADPYVFYTVIVLMVWSGAGYGMVILLAGLQGVPVELREAASIDGANAVQSFRHITLPLLSPVLMYLLILNILWALQTVVQPLLMTSNSTVAGMGGASPAQPGSSDFFMVNVYQQFFSNNEYGYGSALLWFLVAIILVITALIFWTGKSWVYYETE